MTSSNRKRIALVLLSYPAAYLCAHVMDEPPSMRWLYYVWLVAAIALWPFKDPPRPEGAG